MANPQLPRRERRDANWAWWLIGLAVLVGIGYWIYTGYSGDSMREQRAEAPTVRSISENPRDYYGQTVTVNGTVDDVIGTRGFTLGEGIVVLPEGPQVSESRKFQPGEVVQVTGTVMELTGDLKKQIGEEVNQKGPVIMASRIDLSPAGQAEREQGGAAAPGAGGTGTEAPSPQSGQQEQPDAGTSGR
ncbi:MAG: hypothetical protein AB1640_06730 [bacterium]